MISKSIYIKRLLGIAIILLLGGIIYFVFSPEESAIFPRCAFYSITGLKCPGCESQRAIHHLLHLNLKDAFLSNALLILSIPYIALYTYIAIFGGKEKYPRINRTLLGKSAFLVLLILIVVFGVLRNIV